MARNHFFTGKLMVERDFTDEQRFFLGKEQRHNQRLHGSGVVCGLKVTPHPSPACRDQFVVIEPGVAVDCCGREIVVPREECFDFRAAYLAWWEANHDPGVKPDNKNPPRPLAICVRYAECPTEDVPALFDECGCDDTACQPNRILEHYRFDIEVDPRFPVHDPLGPRLTWGCSQNLAHARGVALHSGTSRAFVLTAGAPAALYAVDTAHGAVVASQTFADQTGLDVAVSADGKRVYVALQPSPAATDPSILVLDAADLSAAPVNTLAVVGAGGASVRLLTAPDGRLYVTNPPKGQVLVWGADINTAPPAPNPATAVAVGTSPSALTTSESGDYVFVANPGSSSVTAIRTSDLVPSTIQIPVGGGGGAQPEDIAVMPTTPDTYRLAVLDAAAQRLYLVDWKSGTTPTSTAIAQQNGFAHHPVAIVMSPGGNWLYVLEDDDTDHKAYVQPVDVNRVALSLPNPLAEARLVGTAPRRMALSDDGSRLYVAYDGDAKTDPGGVAIVEIDDQSCGDLFAQTLDGCPACAQADCLILATVPAYAYNDALGPGGAELDNLSHRRILPSTDVIADVVRCLLERGQGGAGPPGPAGPAGQNGQGIDNVQAQFVNCTVAPPQPTISGSAGNRTLNLTIPRGCDGAPGLGIDKATAKLVACDFTGQIAQISGSSPNRTLELSIPSMCDTSLTGVCAINWKHDSPNQVPLVSGTDAFGFLIRFAQRVRAEDINANTFRVLFAPSSDNNQNCWCELVPTRVGGISIASSVCSLDKADLGSFPAPTGKLVEGALWMIRDPHQLRPGMYRIELKCDFIRDLNGKAVDGNHLPPWLPTQTTGDGVQGGTFESWLTLTQ
jgi:DNA-binding beta-propeller fold protein YncE